MNQRKKTQPPLTQYELMSMLNRIRRKRPNLDQSLTEPTLTDWAVLSRIVEHSRNMPECGFMSYPSRETLSEESGVSMRAVTDSIKRLAAYKWIFVYRNGVMKRRNEYYINAQKIVDAYIQTNESPDEPAGVIFPTPESVMREEVTEGGDLFSDVNHSENDDTDIQFFVELCARQP